MQLRVVGRDFELLIATVSFEVSLDARVRKRSLDASGVFPTLHGNPMDKARNQSAGAEFDIKRSSLLIGSAQLQSSSTRTASGLRDNRTQPAGEQSRHAEIHRTERG